MANKEKDKQTKTAPPRESDATRQQRLINQLGLKSEGSAKMRRYKERQQGGNRKGGRR